MNRFCVLTMLSIISVQAGAQIEATVSGRAMDAQTQQPLPYATVTVTRAPESLAVTGILSDAEGRVLLRGSDRVSILVDSRFSSLTGFGNQSGLDSVPAGNVESIEIINNPSAAYDASGMAGIINIVFRQDREEGLNIDAGLTLGVGTLSKRRQDLPTELGSFSNNQKIIPNFNLSHNTPSRRFFFQSEFLVQDDLPNNEFTTRFYDAGREIMSQVPENRDQEQYIVSS